MKSKQDNRRVVELYNGSMKGILPGSVPCDPKKLHDLIAKMDLMICDVSRGIGFASNTLSGQMNAGVVSGPMANGLEKLYNIHREEYEYIPPKPEEEKAIDEPAKEQEKPNVPENEVPVTETAMYEIMKSAMLDALNESFTMNVKLLRGTIAAAVSYSMRQELAKTQNGGAQ